MGKRLVTYGERERERQKYIRSRADRHAAAKLQPAVEQMQMLRSLHPPDALCSLSVTKFCLTGREFMRGGWLALPSLVNAGNVVTRIKLSLRLLLSLTR
jgi:CBS-domain-containing membrane protein